MLIAHRGIVNNVVKENTIPAFLGAINNSDYVGFELDIYMSKDKEFIIYHDLLLDNKFIWKYSYKELKRKGIIRLEDVLKLKTNKLILIDIKDVNLDIDKLSNLLNKYKKKNIYVMSFFNSVIKKFKNKTFKVGLLNYVLNSNKEYSYNFIGLLYDVASTSLITKFKEKGIEVFIYNVNKKDKFIYNDVYYIVDSTNY
ncbi:MAG: glycerophosphodiester phosphodiesterase [Firmicutes bacterium]|nr:glycerophosphodiester phosphodiesterase [Bacillota bacterium]